MNDPRENDCPIGVWSRETKMHNAYISFHQLAALIQGFPSCVSATTLTGFHFSVTALIGWISNATGYSESKSVPFWELLWFSIIANTSIAAMNFSLMLNSVGFYQVQSLPLLLLVLTHHHRP